jgi:hypothetical protein
MTGLGTQRQGNWCRTLLRENKFISSLLLPDRICKPPGLVGSFPGTKRLGRDAVHLRLAPKVKNEWSIPPLSHTLSWRGA